MLNSEYWLTVIATALIVVLCMLMHDEGLRLASGRLPTPGRKPRRHMIALTLALLTRSAPLMFPKMLTTWNHGD